jgi:hypothetical protein
LNQFSDLDITGRQVGAADLDGDGCADLMVRLADGEVRVYWGGPGGLAPDRVSVVPVALDGDGNAKDARPLPPAYEEAVEDAVPLVRSICLGGVPHVFVARRQACHLVPVGKDRNFGRPLVLACAESMAIAAGNLSGAGSQDLAIACRQPDGDRQVSWIYWQNPGGYSDAKRTALRTLFACDVALADLRGAGCDDVAICQNNDRKSFSVESLVYRGGGNHAGGEPVRLASHDAQRVLIARPAGGAMPSVVLINRVSRNMLGNIESVIYFGDSCGYSPERRRLLPAWGAVDAVCADLNDDGWPDLVFANAAENSVDHDPGSYVYFNGPKGFPPGPDLKLPTMRAHGVACADLNRDGYLDLVFCGFDNPDLLIFYGTAEGFDARNPTRIRLEHEGVVYRDPRWPILADLNNDGYLDLIVPECGVGRVFILWGGPDGFSLARCLVLPVRGAISARAADLSGNGYLDLIVGTLPASLDRPHDAFVHIFWNSEAGLSTARCAQLPADHVNCVAAADFNNDGRLDLFVGSYDDNLCRDLDSWIYWNRKDKLFSAGDRTRLFTHSASGCLAADLNGDGWVDLVVANHKVWGDHVGYSEVWWNGPGGFDAKNTTRLPTSGPHGMAWTGIGNIMDAGPEEYYESAPAEFPAGFAPGWIRWEADVPPGTWVKAQLRCGATRDELLRAPWVGKGGAGGWFEQGDELAALRGKWRWLQYRLALGARSGLNTPRLRAVIVAPVG